jgi:hypothetical protein
MGHLCHLRVLLDDRRAARAAVEDTLRVNSRRAARAVGSLPRRAI